MHTNIEYRYTNDVFCPWLISLKIVLASGGGIGNAIFCQ